MPYILGIDSKLLSGGYELDETFEVSLLIPLSQ